MNQRFSILGLIFSVMVSVENSTALLNNELLSQPIKMNVNHSIMKMKTIFLKTKSSDFALNVNNYNRTKELNAFNASRSNKTIPIFSRSLKDIQFIKSSQKTRFPRNVKKPTNNNNKENTSGQNLKVIIDLQSENEENGYDYYDTEKYYDDNQESNINGLVDDWSLIHEMDKNSIPITRTLNESQERKRCVKKCEQILESGKIQQSQNLLQGNIEDERKLESVNKNFQFSKSSNAILEEPNKSLNNTLRLKQIDDDYFINILKQLIDKLNKNKLKSSNHRDILTLKNNEPDQMSIENKSINEKTTNSSSEEEWILKFEKTKGNRIKDKLNSSPENTFINGNWIRNKIIKNKSNDCKSLVNELGIEINDKAESIAKSDIKPSNLLIPENHITETDVEMSKTLNNFQTVTQVNTEIPTSPKPGRNEHPLVSGETIKPLSSTTKDNLESTLIDENDNNQEKSIEPTINYVQTSSTIELNEESTSKPNNSLKFKKPDGISESYTHENKNQPKTNNLNEVTIVTDSGSKEKENNSLENNVNYNCDNKIVKQILSSIMIQNITEIKTNTKIPSKNQKVNVLNKRSSQSQKSNGDINSSKKNIEELDKNSLNKSMTIINNKQLPNDTNYNAKKNMNNIYKKFSSKDISSELNLEQFKLGGQRKINKEEKFNNIDEINYKRIHLIPTKKDVKKSVTNLRKNIQIKNNTNFGNNFVEYKDILIGNNKIYTTPKIPSIMLTKSISRNKLEESIEHTKYGDLISDTNQKKVITKLKHDVPINLKTYYSKRNSSTKNTNDDILVKKGSSVSMHLSPAPIKIINKLSPTIKSRRPEQNVENSHDILNNDSRKIGTKSKYKSQLNTEGKKVPTNIHIDQKQISLKDSEDNNSDLKLRKTPSLVKSIDDSINKIIPTNTHEVVDLTKNSTISNNRIIKNKNTLKPEIWKPTQLVQTSKTFTQLSGTTESMENDEISSTLKSKKSLSDDKKKFSLVPLVLEKKKPLTKFDLFDVSSSPLKKKDSIEGQSLTAGLKSNLKSNYKHDPKILLKSKPQKDIFDHAPYNIEDFKPILFNESPKKQKISKTNSKLSLQYPATWQSLFGNQLPNIQGLKSLQLTSIIHPEYDDYHTGKISKGKQGLNTSNYGPITLDYIEYDDENSKEKSLNRSRFEVLPPVKVANGIFKIPLVGHTIYHNNGSEHMSDIFIPIEKSNGQHSVLSLKELLTGDFNLLNRHDDRILDIKSKSKSDSISNSAWIPKGETNFDVTENLFDPKTLMALRGNKEDTQTAPIHIIQIINNSLCPGNHNGTKDVKNSEYINNDAVKFQQLRNDDKRMLTSRLRSSSNDRQINPKFEKAYNHFDSEILDKFLQVYSPINTV